MTGRKGIDWSSLAEDYERLGTQNAVAAEYDCCQQMVACKMRQLNIPTRYDRSGSRNPKWRGGRRKDTDGYIQVYAPDHPYRNVRNEVAEHRVVMERVIGRHLDPHEVIHHINGIKSDNRPENLELLDDQGAHVYEKHRQFRDKLGRFYASPRAAQAADEAIDARGVFASPRQKQVLELWQQGCSRKDIGRHLGINHKLVHHHLTALLNKGLIASRRESPISCSVPQSR